MRKILPLILFCIAAVSAYAQSAYDSINISRAEEVSALHIPSGDTLSSYLVFAVQDYVMVVVENERSYAYYYYQTENGVAGCTFIGSEQQKKEVRKRKQNRCVLNQLFGESEVCRTSSVFFPESMYKHTTYQAYSY